MTLANIGTDGDCLHDALKAYGVAMDGNIVYSAEANTVTVPLTLIGNFVLNKEVQTVTSRLLKESLTH